MPSEPQAISQQLAGYITTTEGSTGVCARLTYYGRDPYAITVTITDVAGVVQIWRVSRELITRAEDADESCPAGLDRIRLWTRPDPGHATLVIGMTASFLAVLELDLEPVIKFMSRTLELVPSGRESAYLDPDAELAELTSQR
jgi:Streptomyces sporulation and cell division protein, SsgA